MPDTDCWRLGAADCAEHVLPLFEARNLSDDRPRRAIETARAWARGEVSVGDAQKAAVAAHAAARAATSQAAAGKSIESKAATAAARAAGHAVATAHMADHCLGPVIYGLKAVEAIGASIDDERTWQLEQLPEELRELVISALQIRLAGRWT